MGFQVQLRGILEQRGISQSELARQAGVSFASINRLANGSTTATLRTVGKICDYLDIRPEELFTWRPERRKR